jgi:hypothetical protein
MSHHKPKPLMTPVSHEKRCPVCGEPSYSKDGIHPQCASSQADAERLKQRKARTKNVENAPRESGKEE